MTTVPTVLPLMLSPRFVEAMSLIDPSVRTALRFRMIRDALTLARHRVRGVPPDVIAATELHLAKIEKRYAA